MPARTVSGGQPRQSSSIINRTAESRSCLRIPTLSKPKQQSASAAGSPARPVHLRSTATSVQTSAARKQHVPVTGKTRSRVPDPKASSSPLATEARSPPTRTVTFTKSTQEDRQAQPLRQQGAPRRQGTGLFSLHSTNTGLSTASSHAFEWQMTEEMTGYKRNTHSKANPAYYSRELRNRHIERKLSW